jgi:hypothetical protein
MSATKKLLLRLGGAAIVATGVASAASAQTLVAAGVDACELYAREYAAVHVPLFGLLGWNLAYRHGYNACIAGGPSFVPEHPVYVDLGYGFILTGPFARIGAGAAVPLAASTLTPAVPVAATAVVQGSPEWNAYCAAKYRSFNPVTGMYLAYSGTYRMCS